ncbi:MAG: hypothetical protein KGL39_39770 [Patescibacteria group bacterium]|nr:hypothetical protein [Patescibacteria group bacterium]
MNDPEYYRDQPHKCPVCDGTGLVSRPPGIPGDVTTWPSDGTYPYMCTACDGRGILWRPLRIYTLKGYQVISPQT